MEGCLYVGSQLITLSSRLQWLNVVHFVLLLRSVQEWHQNIGGIMTFIADVFDMNNSCWAVFYCISVYLCVSSVYFMGHVAWNKLNSSSHHHHHHL